MSLSHNFPTEEGLQENIGNSFAQNIKDHVLERLDYELELYEKEKITEETTTKKDQQDKEVVEFKKSIDSVIERENVVLKCFFNRTYLGVLDFLVVLFFVWLL